MNITAIIVMAIVYFALFAITDAINKIKYNEYATHLMLVISTFVGMIYLALLHN